MYSDFVGAAIIILTALLAEETKRMWLKRILWSAFVLAVIAQVALQRSERKAQVSEARSAAQDAKKDKDSVMDLLKSSQNLLVGLQSETRDIRVKLGGGPLGKSNDAALLARATSAEQAANNLEQLYSWEIKKSEWPYGAWGVDYPGLHGFFLSNFNSKQLNELTGTDRFILYYLLKHNCQLNSPVKFTLPNGRPSFGWEELQTLYEKEFGPDNGNITSSIVKLEGLGYLEVLPSNGTERLKQPFCSLAKNLP